LLKQIGVITLGKYFEANDKQSLETVYDDINDLEKTKVDVKSFQRFSESYYALALAAAIALLLEMVLRYTFFRTI